MNKWLLWLRWSWRDLRQRWLQVLAIALIIAGKIANVDQIRVLRANMPFFWGLIAFVLIAIAVPEIATWLPDLVRNK